MRRLCSSRVLSFWYNFFNRVYLEKTLRIFTNIQVTNEVSVLFYLLINVKTCLAIDLIPFTVG